MDEKNNYNLTNPDFDIKYATRLQNRIKGVEIAVDRQSVTVFPEKGKPVELTFTDNGRLRPQLKHNIAD